MIHKIVVISMLNNIVIQARHITGKFNVIADYGSLVKGEGECHPGNIPTMVDGIAKVFLSSLAMGFVSVYKIMWLLYLSFFEKINLKEVNNSGHVLLLLHSLFDKGLSSTTITSKLSSLNYLFSL